VRDEYEVVADDVDGKRGEEEEDNDPELPVMVEAAPIGDVGLVRTLVGFVGGCGVWIVRLDFAHGGGAFRVAGFSLRLLGKTPLAAGWMSGGGDA